MSGGLSLASAHVICSTSQGQGTVRSSGLCHEDDNMHEQQLHCACNGASGISKAGALSVALLCCFADPTWEQSVLCSLATQNK